MKRARNADQKGERRKAILDAGRHLYCERGDMGRVTMDAVAHKAKLAKGTLYLYFQTKEHLFLAILEEELRDWLAALKATLACVESPKNPRELARLLSSQLAGRPMMTALMACLPTTLENNIGEETAREFKLATLALSEAFAICLEKGLDLPRSPNSLRACHWIFSLILGIYQIAVPAPTMRKVLETTPELFAYRMDFENEICAALENLFLGLTKSTSF